DRAQRCQRGKVPEAHSLLPADDEFTGKRMQRNAAEYSGASRQRLAGAAIAALPALQRLPSVLEVRRREKPFAAREKRDVFNGAFVWLKLKTLLSIGQAVAPHKAQWIGHRQDVAAGLEGKIIKITTGRQT